MSGSQTQTETRINRDRFKRAELTNVDESCSMCPPPPPPLIGEGKSATSELFPINRFGGIDKWLA
ncbi:hypothetical protein [Candidatus Endomicrobiellum trichonymphae]|uniref:hypothetical protein n=1 Tax=Endomicrobium trichonymphae TaxID=1408204 RepID=UPI001E2A06D3|nr:hypothetical protein [Candidatus Endomicrobium trichonymphae]